MAKERSWRLVIDADIACSAGNASAKDPTSKSCRDFLIAVRRTCHRLVMTPDIKAEWGKHQSGFARKWRVKMVGSRKLCYLEDVKETLVLGDLKSVPCSDLDFDAMDKDRHLLNAALASDKIVASRDDEVRGLFAAATPKLTKISQIVWVNPTKEDEGVVGWLEKGSMGEKFRQLGSPATGVSPHRARQR